MRRPPRPNGNGIGEVIRLEHTEAIQDPSMDPDALNTIIRETATGLAVLNRTVNQIDEAVAQHGKKLDIALEVAIAANATASQTAQSVDDHSAMLGGLIASMSRIERWLGIVDRKAERASQTNELTTDLARITVTRVENDIEIDAERKKKNLQIRFLAVSLALTIIGWIVQNYLGH